MRRRLAVGVAAVVCVVLSASWASAQPNLLCDYCNGRGYLTAEPNPYYCTCKCNSADIAPVDPTYPQIRRFNMSSGVSIALLPPTCRYLEGESLTAQLILGVPAATTNAESLISAMGTYLQLSRRDQLVFQHLEDAPNAESILTFDIRGEGTSVNSSLGTEDLSVASRALFAKLSDAVTAATPPAWVGAYQVRSIATVERAAGPTNKLSFVVAKIRGYPVYLEPLLFFSVAVLMVLLFPLVEANLTTKEVGAKPPVTNVVASPTVAVYVPTPGADDNVEEEALERLPRQSSRARRKSITSDGGDNDGAQREHREAPESLPEEFPYFERKKSRAAQFYFTGE